MDHIINLEKKVQNTITQQVIPVLGKQLTTLQKDKELQ